tara:strand:+ start:6430 stop:6624 length:195 start_codon:yes stop_codon:yes gene_type:complete
VVGKLTEEDVNKNKNKPMTVTIQGDSSIVVRQVQDSIHEQTKMKVSLQQTINYIIANYKNNNVF